MPVTHTNRRGETYHLLQGLTKTGKPKYHVSRKTGPNTVDAIPDGYELFENPVDAIVHVRKIRPTSILPEELDETKGIIRRVTGKTIFYVLCEGAALIVYWPDRDPEVASQMFSTIFGAALPGSSSDAATIDPGVMMFLRTTAVLKFVLSNEKKRTFAAERMCFRGEGFWLPCSKSMALATLVESLSRHLGQESFYEIGL
jgi:hypothetical protein